MNCFYCQRLLDKSTTCYNDPDNHVFIYYNSMEWWVILKYIEANFRFEILKDIPPTMYVFITTQSNPIYELHIPFDKHNIKEIADKYSQLYLKLKAFT